MSYRKGTHSQGSRSPRGMRPHSQIRRDARRWNILSTSVPTSKVTWNVRTMTVWSRKVCKYISKEMRDYNMEILGLCERSWVQAGQTRLRTGNAIIYSGNEDSNAPHTQRLVLMQKASKWLIGWNPVIVRQMVVEIRTSP